MSVFKRGETYWFEFFKDGVRYQRTTKQRNYAAAVDIESAFRTALAKGDVGITERPKVPTLRAFKPTFSAWIDESKKNARTREFYSINFAKLLAFPSLAGAPLDRIDEPLIEKFKSKMLANG